MSSTDEAYEKHQEYINGLANQPSPMRMQRDDALRKLRQAERERDKLLSAINNIHHLAEHGKGGTQNADYYYITSVTEPILRSAGRIK